MGLYVFAADHPGDGRNVIARNLGDILQDHGLELRLVPVDEIVVLEVDDGLHRSLQGVVALLERLDEPFRRIHLLLDEDSRFLGLGIVAGLGCFQQLRILPLDLHLREREARHRQQEFPLRAELQLEVRHDLLRLVGIGIVDLAARGGIELDDLLQRRLERVLVDAHTEHDLLEVLADEVVVMVAQDDLGIADLLRPRHRPQLEQEAFTQVPGTNPGRLELLDDLQDTEHFLLVGLDILAESEVVHQRGEVAAQVAVAVQAADDEIAHFLLVRAERTEAELLPQTLGETLLDGEGVVFRTLVLAPVVDSHLVGGNVARIVLDLLNGDILGRLIGIVLALGRVLVIQDRIVLPLGLDGLAEFENRRLDQAYRRDLERRQLLGLLDFQSELLHRASSSEPRDGRPGPCPSHSCCDGPRPDS